MFKKSLFIYKKVIRKDGDLFKQGVSAFVSDTDGDNTIKGKEYRGSECLW